MKRAWDFSFEEGNPFMLKLSNEKFLIFLRNISPAYFKHSLDVTRMQLKYNPIYDKAIKTNIPIIVLGYDSDNDVFVSWNPSDIRSRINTRPNVSLYSRKSLQSEAKGKTFTEGVLSNGAKFIVFKRSLVVDYFRDLENLFDYEPEDLETLPSDGSEDNVNPNKIVSITDKELIKKLKPLLKGNRVLEAATLCHSHYGNIYKGMKMKDWLNVANDMYLAMSK